MKTFVFTYKREIEITVQAVDEPTAWQELQNKIEQAHALGVAIPRMPLHYRLFSAY